MSNLEFATLFVNQNELMLTFDDNTTLYSPCFSPEEAEAIVETFKKLYKVYIGEAHISDKERRK